MIDAFPRMARTWLWALGLLAVIGCARSAPSKQAAVPAPPPPSSAGIATVDYWRDVQPILERRCIVCHGCYDAPCQLNLTAYEGVARGANKKPVYDATRLLTAQPTRLFEDADTVAAWRDKKFFPVLQEDEKATEEARRAGVFARMLALKRTHALPDQSILPDSFDLSLDRDQQCPTETEVDAYAQKYPQWGMPYGLPGLTDDEYYTLIRWIQQGAPYHAPDSLPPSVKAQVDEWEAFLNGDAPKQILMSRYLYEHLHITHLYFDGLPDRRWFRLVRSRTAPGQPIDRIATRRPYDDPGTPRVYYRFEPVHAGLLAKTHIPYPLSQARKQRFTELFLDAPFEVRALPGYEPKIASNPFVSFRDLPVRSRYKFLLDDAQTFVMQFIKGPVCRGQVALNVIDDRFWMFFIDPDSAALDGKDEYLAETSDYLYLPTAEGARWGPISWIKYSGMQKEFLKAKQAYLESLDLKGEAAGLAFIWNGRDRNRNAALTVFRHADSASVVQGLVGDDPKTAWLLSYDLFERIYYLLVAGFDVYGFTGHQLDTRLYMDFLRMEGESNFLLLLPAKDRERERDYWYRDAHDSVKEYVLGRRINVEKESGIPYRTDRPKHELFDMLARHVGGALNHAYDVAGEQDADVREQLQGLSKIKGRVLQWMPEVALLTVTEGPGREGQGDRLYTLLHDNGFSNIASLFNEASRRLPDEDGVTVARGLIGAYPNAFYRVNKQDLPEFIAMVASLRNEDDYRTLTAHFGLRRTSRDFWRHSDAVHETYRRIDPIEAGSLDYNRLENR
ncbi:putative fatty acid cis/trans isomerase [Nitrospira japonica]|uniref:Putative fatty acid cis/trans isomerase n=1 Tax=Nitrospira japonica TaxID=1325564 RepID=A0A1W1I911_9BACT|nr:fatty acid cis/trans isomerase [Nitrospira japonica]SLM49486.1 putative fatty acid cis/trans isomerase [Nitrospira japonica]